MYAKQLEYETPYSYVDEMLKEYDRCLKRNRFTGLPCECNLNSDEVNQMREAMIKGYMEMASINQSIAEEFSYVEMKLSV